MNDYAFFTFSSIVHFKIQVFGFAFSIYNLLVNQFRDFNHSFTPSHWLLDYRSNSFCFLLFKKCIYAVNLGKMTTSLIVRSLDRHVIFLTHMTRTIKSRNHGSCETRLNYESLCFRELHMLLCKRQLE